MKSILVLFIILYSLFIIPQRVHAISDPFAVDNNKFGIHILFPDELDKAATLINSNGGAWGYVTIPIQAGDKDIEKWQTFFNKARQYRVIPLMRLATEGDYFNTKVWRKPNEEDILDFANFLNSLEWPTKNRYIIVFNEVNRSNEWGGSTNPFEYARLLGYAVDVFKEKNDDFFIISSGMDNGASTVLGQAYSQYSYYQLMEHEVPDIFEKIDGFSSHSYPNPAFSQPPSSYGYHSARSFSYERSAIGQFTKKRLPIFITEAGWSKNMLSENTIASYMKEAFFTIWTDPDIVAITPFLLQAGSEPFAQFSFLALDGSPNLLYRSIFELPKIQGKPKIEEITTVSMKKQNINAPTKDFSKIRLHPITIEVPLAFKNLAKWFFGML